MQNRQRLFALISVFALLAGSAFAQEGADKSGGTILPAAGSSPEAAPGLAPGREIRFTELLAQTRPQRRGFSLMPFYSLTPMAAGPNLSVLGGGTLGRLTKWTGLTSSNSFIGDSTIFESKYGLVGIGTDSPTSKLTVAGVIQSTGGFRFPDGTVQTTSASGALFSVAHDATLVGNGTAGSPLGVALPLVLSGAGGPQGVIELTNTSNGGAGVGAVGGVSSNIGGAGVLARGGVGSSNGGPGVFAIGGGSDSIGGLGVAGFGGVSGNFAGSGVAGTGGNSNSRPGGDGVLGTGGNSDSSFGGDGVLGTGGDSNSGEGGRGVAALGGDSNNGDGGRGVVAIGGVGRGAGNEGGRGIEASGGDGVDGAAKGAAGVFLGDVAVNGDLNVFGGTKNFQIDHPLDPENRYLYHAAIESSEVLNLYTGNVVTDDNGEAVVQLPDWFEAVNSDFRYQLTVIGSFSQAIVASKVKDHRFTIRTSVPNVEVSWQVTGLRSDPVMRRRPFKVEVQKPERERGYYLTPEAYDQPEERGIEWARNPERMQQLKQRRLEAERGHKPLDR